MKGKIKKTGRKRGRDEGGEEKIMRMIWRRRRIGEAEETGEIREAGKKWEKGGNERGRLLKRRRERRRGEECCREEPYLFPNCACAVMTEP